MRKHDTRLMHALRRVRRMAGILTALVCGGVGVGQEIEENLPGGRGVFSSRTATDIWITSPTGAIFYGVNDNRLRVGGAGDYNYILFRFDVTDQNVVPPIRDPRTVKALLTLYCFGNGGGSNVAMLLDVVTSPWDANIGAFAPPPSATFVKQVPAPRLNATYNLDITELLVRWQAGTIPNHGLQLRPTLNINHFNEFRSVEATSGAPSLQYAYKYVFQFPMPSVGTGTPRHASISSDFGTHWQNTYCGAQRLLNTGVDLPAPVGTEVVAVAPGIVRLATKDQQSGGCVVIEHGGVDGPYTTTYQNVKPVKKKKGAKESGDDAAALEDLQPGDFVARGELIGRLVLGSYQHEANLRFQLRAGPFSMPISTRGTLPETVSCAGDPAFPEDFIDPKAAIWTWSFPQ